MVLWKSVPPGHQGQQQTTTSKMLRKINNSQKLISILTKEIRYSSTSVVQNNEVDKIEVVYPETEDLSREGRNKKKYFMSAKEIQLLPTIEEKLFKVNMPRYYGWKPFIFDEYTLHYNVLPFSQCITKTHLIPERGLPSCYDHMIDPGTLNELVTSIKNQIEDAFVLEFTKRRRDDISVKDKTDKKSLDVIMTQSIIHQINRIITTNLSEKYSHLISTEMDYQPRVEAFWVLGGIPPRKSLEKARQKCWQKDFANEPLDEMIQYKGNPLLQLRNSLPLREIISLEESKDTTLEVPDFKFNPGTLGYTNERRHVTNIPGFWPGDNNEFGLLSFHNQIDVKYRNFDDYNESLIAQAILASFGWLMTQACYQGFSPYNDITYPLINQMVITNGQSWSFFVYQLNTTEMSKIVIESNPKRNICWATESMNLYESIEEGKVKGFNDDVLKHLLKFYINVPEQRDYNMKPYLDERIKVIANYDDDHKRQWLEEHFKHLMSIRPRHRPLPEILQWQKIFMIDNKTRPLEKKREPWEFGINPYKRRLDEHHPKYIPKALRPHPKRKIRLEKWEKTYYP